MEVLTYQEWLIHMTPEITYNGRVYQNFGITKDEREYVEDWTTGERVFLPSAIYITKGGRQFKCYDTEVNVEFCIPTDPRFICTGHREYSDEMYAPYLAIGADKWEYDPRKVPGWTLPPPLE